MGTGERRCISLIECAVYGPPYRCGSKTAVLRWPPQRQSMPFTKVVILGGGPIGLLCAIEARRCFQSVVVIEKRGGYTRTNVPSLNNDLIRHLKKIGVAPDLWPGTDPSNGVGQSVAFSKIEEALWKKASSIGVVMERGCTVSLIRGEKKMDNGRFKRMRLTLAPWDDKAKALVPHAPTKDLFADLLVVASGGSAARDALVLQTLGFEFRRLKAKNYAAYGIFQGSTAPPDNSPESGQRKTEMIGLTSQVVSGRIAFTTPDHNYLLVTLSQCTRDDFKYLQQNAKAFQTLLKAVSQGYMTEILAEIKQVQKNTGLFKVSIQRARHFYSAKFPAVIVGDAAVTPHPEAGSGMVTGFAGVCQLITLFEALRGTNRSADNSGAWLQFDQQYELFVSKKALEGTRIVLRNLVKLLERFLSDTRSVREEFDMRELIEIADKFINTAETLHMLLKYHDLRALRLLDILNGESEKFDWNKCGVDQLWSDIGVTYQAIKRLTEDICLFQDRLDRIELALATRKVTGKAVAV